MDCNFEIKLYRSATWTTFSRARICRESGGLRLRLSNDEAIVHTICDLLDELKPRPDGKSYRTQITYVADRPGHDRRYAIDARKIEQELGWKPSETFESGIRKTVMWYLQNPGWVANVQNGSYREWVAQQYGPSSVAAPVA